MGGTFLDDHGWIRTNGVNSEAHGRATNIFGRLSLGTPVLTAGLGADRRAQSLISSSSPTLIQEDFTAFAAWRPLDLPELELRVNRSNAYDSTRRAQDTTTDSALFSVRYKGPAFDLRYTLSWLRTEDRLHESESTGVDQTVLASRSDTIFSGRTTTYVSATLQNHDVTVGARGSGGTVTQQQVPAAGLSGIAALPATSDNIVLAPNPGVIDGNTTASAGLNVGFGPSATGDRNMREAGARFSDVVTSVNTIYVWLDKQPVGTVGQALAGSVQVWQSNDPAGQRWTQITPLPTPPIVSPFQNRIEIAIPQTAARFLKVSVQPIAVGTTTDLSYRDVNITEVQFLLVLPISQLPKQQSSLFVSATALARTVLLQQPELAHDFSATVGHRSDSDLTTYAIVNGLSATKKLRERLTASARFARQDSESGAGHEGLWLWSAALAGTPLPTANWTLTYAGTYSDRDEVTHSLNGLGRADWYQGISTQASAGASFLAQGLRIGSTFQTSTTTSFRPNALMTLSVGALYSRSAGSSPETGNTMTQTGRLDGSLTLTPAPALSATGTVSRVFLGERLTTLATVQLNYFPLRGDLQLGASYSKTLDTAADATTEILTPSLRWNVRSGVSLTSSFSYLKNAAPVQTSVSRVATVDLIVNI